MMDKHLHKWQQYKETNVAFHRIPGIHNDILRGSNAFSFYQPLENAMQQRRV